MDKTTASSSRSKRKSIAHQPSSASSKDNATTDVAAFQRAESLQNNKKKSRGKSIGPGGLEALRETTGNAIKVLLLLLPREECADNITGRLNPPNSFNPEAHDSTDATKSHPLFRRVATT